MIRRKQSAGFTLAELLVAMAILGIMMAFAIPKILNTLNSSNAAKAKEAMGVVSTAWEKLRFDKNVDTSTTFGDVLQYINYTKLDTTDTTSFADPGDSRLGVGGALEKKCNKVSCVYLANNVIIQYDPAITLGGTEDTRAILVDIDVDGHGSKAGAFSYVLGYTGRSVTGEHVGDPGITLTASTGAFGSVLGTDPDFVHE